MHAPTGIALSATAPTFFLDPDFLNAYIGRQPEWGPVGYVTYKRTYARGLKPKTLYPRHLDLAAAAGLTTSEEWWLTVTRVVEGTFTILANHCLSLHLPWDWARAQRKAQEMFRLMWDFKFLPPGRGLWMMGTPAIEKVGGAALNNCFAPETEVITAEGVKAIGDLDGQTVRLLTRGGKWVDAPVKSFGKQELYAVTLQRQGVAKTVYATADHRWFATDRRKAHRDDGYAEYRTTDLRPDIHRLQYVFGQGMKGNVKPSPFGIAHGFTFGDGRSVPGDRNANAVTLIGDKDAVLRPYFDLCPVHERKDGIGFGSLPNYFREKPSIRENKSYLLGWLMGYFAADGTVKSGQVTICSVERSNIEFVRDVCSVIGIGHYAIRSETCISNLTHREHTMYSLTLMRDTLDSEFFLIPAHRVSFEEAGGSSSGPRYWTVVDVKKTDRYETVYCATVPDEHAFALEGNILTGNCGFVSTEHIDSDFAEPFCMLMDYSMLGVGVGGDTRGAGKVVIQEPRRPLDALVVIGDTREAWIDALRTVLLAYVGVGVLPNFDFSQIRAAGSPIETFGGTASGPGPLRDMIASIVNLLDARIGQAITSADIVDIFNLVGKCVVAGNTRRSAEIMFGEPTDEGFLELKDKEKHGAALDNHRWASNNSVFASVGQGYGKLAKQTAKNGEPGYFWLENAQKYGRMIDAPDFKDKLARGGNPCLEQTLWDGELCNLVETFPAHHGNLKEYLRTVKFAYLYAKVVTLVPTHNPKTNAVTLKNRRIGCSMSGIVQAVRKFGRRRFFNMCDETYAYIQELDEQYSDWMCVPRSIKTTSVKPSGTVSLLPKSVTPGMHYPIAEYYWRVIRFATDSSILPALRAAGYMCIEIDPDKEPNTTAVYFPVRIEDFDRAEKDVSMWEQLELAADLQAHWADNQVSVTVKFDKKTEGPQIARALEIFETRLKGVSFLPHDDHGYDHAPYQPITKAEYEAAVAVIGPLDLSGALNETQEKFCDTDKCLVPAPKA